MLNRRDFLKAALLATATPSLIMPEDIQASSPKPWLNMTSMPLYLKRGKDVARLDLREVGHFSTFRYLTRDVKANTIGYPDPDLAGLVSWIQAVVATRRGVLEPFVITSGLRTKATNRAIEGAAQNSMHLPDERGVFRAIDLYSPKVSPSEIAELAKAAREGGVGLYSSRGFLHIDTGRVRAWGK